MWHILLCKWILRGFCLTWYSISGWFFRVSQNLWKRRKCVPVFICVIFLRFKKFLLPNITGYNFCELNILRFKSSCEKKRKLDQCENYQMYGMLCTFVCSRPALKGNKCYIYQSSENHSNSHRQFTRYVICTRKSRLNII